MENLTHLVTRSKVFCVSSKGKSQERKKKTHKKAGNSCVFPYIEGERPRFSHTISKSDKDTIKKRKLHTNIPDEYGCRSSEPNTSNLNSTAQS